MINAEATLYSKLRFLIKVRRDRDNQLLITKYAVKIITEQHRIFVTQINGKYYIFAGIVTWMDMCATLDPDEPIEVRKLKRMLREKQERIILDFAFMELVYTTARYTLYRRAVANLFLIIAKFQESFSYDHLIKDVDCKRKLARMFGVSHTTLTHRKRSSEIKGRINEK